MKHIFKQGSPSKPTFLMLHGTGGTEQDLLPLAERIDPEASVLSVRGNVSENGMPRFFKRLAEGVFDMEDLKLRTEELRQYLDEASEKYGFDRHNVIAIGYSNGANIAGSLIFHYEDVLKGAILHHPMVPNRDVKLPSLKSLPVFIGAGENDPMCTPNETNDLQQLLNQAGANVELFWHKQGHQLTIEEVDVAKVWYNQQFNV
ncbi:alpha/beta hydrolase [Jeotgalibacillus soli]|uniref:Carboxylesterase n=1 Tax=Jeotgalibacillus soli TaxID=889306 RepID=A0A0C2V8Y2_9BACL|nr:alpha/beta hydrolase [Jeotgalibacillus soli]KIL45432.1 carboxylesterase [Jeotgalibacillus soli]